MRDRRAVERHAVMKPVRIVFESASIRATVLDISIGGVKVCLPAGSLVPEVVLIYLPDETVQAARLKWRNGDDAGFEFLD
jgi:hypothetical protein